MEKIITSKDVYEAIKAHGWLVAKGVTFNWLNDNIVIASQCSKYGYSAFKLAFNDNGLVSFEALQHNS